MELRHYPDPILLKPSPAVEVFDDDLRDRVKRMWEIMYESEGVGLAAPQAGWAARVLVINPSGSRDDTEQAFVLVNPRLTKKWGKCTHQEGCLSFPEIFVDVVRPKGLHLVWQDEHGTEHEADLDDFRARIVLHEIDHLEGVLLVHRMSPADKVKYRHELDELRAIHAEAVKNA